MRRDRIRLVAGAIAGVVVLIGAGTHFLLPSYLAGRVEDRLEKHGGTATVKLRAIPSLRLLAGHGDGIEVRGSGLEVRLDEPREDVFKHLDNFDEVDIELTETAAGPFETKSFRLKRDGGKRYRIDVEATASAAELAQYAGDLFGPLGGLIGSVGGGLLPFSGAPLPVSLHGLLESKDGRAEMVEGEGRVAGLPAGPVAELVTNAILARL